MIFLTRHGESVANTKGIYQGQSIDTDLSNRGKNQAKAIAKALTEYQINGILTSPMKRCIHTAKIICNSINRIIEQNETLIEINHGTWEGKTVDQFDRKEIKMLKEWKLNPHKTQMIQGEHFNDLIKRCQKIIKLLETKKGNYVVVTHDTVSRVLVASILKLPYKFLWNIHLDNCGFTMLEGRPLRIVTLNETSHLNGLHSNIENQAL